MTLAVSQLPPEFGTWGYHAGVSGTVTLGPDQKVLGIACHSTSGTGTVTINGGDSVPVPPNTGLDIAPRGNLQAPTIVFSGTDSFFVEWVL